MIGTFNPMQVYLYLIKIKTTKKGILKKGDNAKDKRLRIR
jgi:hypothetical protein